MGIKTKYNPLGGRTGKIEKGMIYLAEHIGNATSAGGNGVINLAPIISVPRNNVEYSIMGMFSADIIYNGKTYTSAEMYTDLSTTTSARYNSVRRMTPFYNLSSNKASTT